MRTVTAEFANHQAYIPRRSDPGTSLRSVPFSTKQSKRPNQVKRAQRLSVAALLRTQPAANLNMRYGVLVLFSPSIGIAN